MASDGGPAIPRRHNIETGGLTVRDYFAGQALKGLVHHAFERMAEGPDPETGKSYTDKAHAIMGEIGDVCYGMADAMLRARKGDDDA